MKDITVRYDLVWHQFIPSNIKIVLTWRGANNAIIDQA